MKSLNIALVGCGAIAEYHKRSVAVLGDRARITAVVDLDRKRANQFASEAGSGVAVFSSLQQALADGEFDAAVVMLPHDLHESAAQACFDAGKHLLLEKPMAPTLDACDRIMSAARCVETVFMVGENTHYWDIVKHAHQLIESGIIGNVISGQAQYITSLDQTWYPPNSWRFNRKRAGGGVAIDGGSHWIRPLRIWMGEVRQVIATTARPIEKMEGESLVHSMWKFESGAQGTYEFTLVDAAVGPVTWFRITGSRGQLIVDTDLYGGATLRLLDSKHPDGTTVRKSEGYFSSFAPEMANFVAAALDGSPLSAGPEEAIADLKVVLAMYRSADHGRWEDVALPVGPVDRRATQDVGSFPEV